MRERLRWCIYGIAFGFFFPIVAIGSDYFVISKNSDSLIGLILANPLHWIILLAPIVLGAVGSVIGGGRDKLQNLINRLEALNHELKGTNITQETQIRDVVDQLAYYTLQLESINNNIRNGICVIDNEYNIEFGYNKEFTRIFGEKEYLFSSIIDTIFSEGESHKKSELKQFLDIAFTSTTASDFMLNSANPIENFIYSVNRSGHLQKKYLETRIVRFKDKEGSIVKMMFIFNDFTKKKNLETRIEEERKGFQSELSLVTTILCNDQSIVSNFVRETKVKSDEIRTLMNSVERGSRHREVLRRIQGAVHSIKGNSVSLGFQNITQAAKDFEQCLRNVKDGIQTIEEKSEVVLYHGKLDDSFTSLQTTLGKLKTFAGVRYTVDKNSAVVSMAKHHQFLNDAERIIENFKKKELQLADLKTLRDSIQSLTWKNAAQLHKEIALVHDRASAKCQKKSKLNFRASIESLPNAQYNLLKEIFIHLVRNSIAHGIESPKERTLLHKNEAGTVSIRMYKKKDVCFVDYSDDGAGIDITTVKKKLLAAKTHTKEEVNTLPKSKLLGYIFHHGFSTDRETDDISGLGVGMTVVKNNLQTLRGEIQVRNRQGRGLQINLSFPVSP